MTRRTSNQTLEIRERKKQRTRSFFSFFTIILSIYTLINAYIFVRSRQAIPIESWFRPIFSWLFLVVFLSYIVGEYLEHKATTALSNVLVWIGALWLGVMTWAFFACVLVDLGRVIEHFFHILPQSWLADPELTREWIGSVLWIVILIGMFLGFLNARNPRIKQLSITIQKHNPGIDSLRIAMLSDIHMGTIIAQSRVQDMVDKINSIQPDLVLMAGDQIDGNPRPVIERKLGDILSQIRSKYGVFAITGNHEYIGQAEVSCTYLHDHGITMLRDTSVEVAGLQIVGREDLAAKGFAHIERKPLAELVEPLDKSHPIILMDHQPFHLEDAEANGVDLQLSGHTHHAQMWPWSYITKAIYEVSWGYKKKGRTHIYVSCGAGTWGPPIRIGNTPEIMDITIQFKLS